MKYTIKYVVLGLFVYLSVRLGVTTWEKVQTAEQALTERKIAIEEQSLAIERLRVIDEVCNGNPGRYEAFANTINCWRER